MPNLTYSKMKSELFPQIRPEYADYLHHFFNVKLHKNFRLMNLAQKPDIILGEKKFFELGLLPKSGVIGISKHEFHKKILYLYNQEYWLVKLWLRMYSDADGSRLGKELVRAFIKNCINETSKDILNIGKSSLDKSDIKLGNIANRQEFYKRIFNLGKIIRKMRSEPRKVLIRLYQRQKWHHRIISKGIPVTSGSVDIIINFFERNNLEEYAKLIKICHQYNLNEGKKMLDPLEKVFFIFKTQRGQNKKIKRSLKALFDGNNTL